MTLDELLDIVRASTPDQKARLFSELRSSHSIHDLEKQWRIGAEVILEAISRSNDLTKRGVRGVIAETIFALEIVPKLSSWKDVTPAGNHSFDSVLRKKNKDVRVQVKLQRKERGQPKVRKDGSFVVEVQRTRGGLRGGEKTRPYRFTDFDLLAVCMEPSTGDWTSFMYIPVRKLKADVSDKRAIMTFQSVPVHSDSFQGNWTGSLSAALERMTAKRG